jgi:transcriptional regulator with XRE-family HTH domain
MIGREANSRRVINLAANFDAPCGYTPAPMTPPDEKPSFGANLAAALRKAHLSKKRFAELMQVKPPGVSDWINMRGEQLPNGPSLLKMATRLGIPIDDLVRGLEPAYDKFVRRGEEPGADVIDVQRKLRDLRELAEEMLLILDDDAHVQPADVSQSEMRSDAEHRVRARGSSRRSGR